MSRVTFTGWCEGLRKVPLNNLLREKAGMPLQSAKRVVDDLLEGRQVVVDVADDRTAMELASAASELGAICVVGGVPVGVDS
jgi:hypothetical protein